MIHSYQTHLNQINPAINPLVYTSPGNKFVEALFDIAEARDGSASELMKLPQLGISYHLVSRENQNALFYAGNAEVVDFLVKHGLDVNHQDINGKTPIFCTGFSDVLEALIKHGANINHVDLNGETPIFEAIDSDDIQILLDNGAEINHKNFNGETPLFTNFFDKGGIKALVENGVDIEHENKNGETALMVRVLGYRWDEVADLVEAGANLDHKNPQGKTALDLVLDKNRSRIEETGFWNSTAGTDAFILKSILKSLGYKNQK